MYVIVCIMHAASPPPPLTSAKQSNHQDPQKSHTDQKELKGKSSIPKGSTSGSRTSGARKANSALTSETKDVKHQDLLLPDKKTEKPTDKSPPGMMHCTCAETHLYYCSSVIIQLLVKMKITLILRRIENCRLIFGVTF